MSISLSPVTPTFIFPAVLPVLVISEETINEPVICVLLVVATNEPVVANTTGSTSVPVTSPPEDEAWATVEIIVPALFTNY